ncbi:peptidoglycan-binding protein [Streptomyces olivoreticuli]|uniref:peptidoglycan-binding protein n=1 Tax=Streptomyces olivoreticuli TaxID=68246 RepID=UPI001F080932|nr:peptidoglycan-binding protein [Streptomyces olivoreticuli]
MHTIAVTRTDLANTMELTGTLGYGFERVLKGAKKGLVTRLPETGAAVDRGKPVYWVDDQPVMAFFGDTPLFRTLEPAMKGKKPLVGRDVKMVAENLKALGYDIGAQPTPGWSPTTPADGRPHGDDVGEFTPALSEALKRWQRAAGMQATGTLGIGDIAVFPGAARISSIKAALGDDAGGELLTITQTGKTVTVPVEATQAGQAKAGARVTVVLPDGTETDGKIKEISRTATDSSKNGAGEARTSPKLDVTVLLDSGHQIKDLDAAPVQVRFTTETRRGVLAVPVGALTALREGGYAVQLPDGKLIAVKTGMFARGMVEITGENITEGTQVVTTT